VKFNFLIIDFNERINMTKKIKKPANYLNKINTQNYLINIIK